MGAAPPLYDIVCYSVVLDITLNIVGPQLVILDYFCYNVSYSSYNMNWISSTEIGLDPNASIIKRL